ncbi:MAG: hypothetical protein MZU95_15450 [Desulfomicrobium escambiense]|nr:hypothetical protein [Desulfomicrobium escambiense]
MKKLMTGNEAVARGAWEAGVTFASAYPGTPSTEILENIIADYKDDIYAAVGGQREGGHGSGPGRQLSPAPAPWWP